MITKLDLNGMETGKHVIYLFPETEKKSVTVSCLIKRPFKMQVLIFLNFKPISKILPRDHSIRMTGVRPFHRTQTNKKNLNALSTSTLQTDSTCQNKGEHPYPPASASYLPSKKQKRDGIKKHPGALPRGKNRGEECFTGINVFFFNGKRSGTLDCDISVSGRERERTIENCQISELGLSGILNLLEC